MKTPNLTERLERGRRLFGGPVQPRPRTEHDYFGIVEQLDKIEAVALSGDEDAFGHLLSIALIAANKVESFTDKRRPVTDGTAPVTRREAIFRSAQDTRDDWPRIDIKIWGQKRDQIEGCIRCAIELFRRIRRVGKVPTPRDCSIPQKIIQSVKKLPPISDDSVATWAKVVVEYLMAINVGNEPFAIDHAKPETEKRKRRKIALAQKWTKKGNAEGDFHLETRGMIQAQRAAETTTSHGDIRDALLKAVTSRLHTMLKNVPKRLGSI